MGRGRRTAGTGTVFFREDRGKWVAELTTGYNKKGNPKKITRYADTKVEAKKILARLMVAFEKGTLVRPHDQTLAQCLDAYLEGIHSIKESTRSRYAWEISILKCLLGKRKVQKVTPNEVRGVINEIAKSYAPRTLKKCSQHLIAALDEAVALNVLINNPARKVSVPSTNQTEAATAWTEAEATAFLKAARGDALYDLFYLYLSTGLRRAEAVGIPWLAVDLKEKTIRIDQQIAEYGSTFEISSLKTKHSRRVIYVGDEVLNLLKVRQASQALLREYQGDKWSDAGLVFTTKYGTLIRPTNVYRSFQRLIKPLDVTRIRLHDLRHIYATLALLKGRPVEVVSKNLGHANVSITMDTYRHVMDFERKSAFLSFADLLGNE